jgi:DNA-binding response OmpR family regulator
VRLTAREGALFELLLRRRGKVVSRSGDSGAHLEDSYDLSTNIIDVYINALRKKLDSAPGEADPDGARRGLPDRPAKAEEPGPDEG